MKGKKKRPGNGIFKKSVEVAVEKLRKAFNNAGDSFYYSLRKIDVKKAAIMNSPYIVAFYIVEKEAWLYRNLGAGSLMQKLTSLFLYAGYAFKDPLPSFHIWDMSVGALAASGFKLFILYRQKNAKKYRHGVEYGSARWGNEKDIRPLIDPVFENNIILTKTEFLTMDSRPKNPNVVT